MKICDRPNDYYHEVYFLKYFADQLPVPRIIQLVEPETNVHGAILMECLPGTVLKKTDMTEALAFEIGSLLAQIHSNRTAGYGDLIQPEKLSPDPRVHFTLKFEESLAECSDHLPKALMDQCRRYYDAHVNLLDSVDGPCMIHRDFRPGNIIADKGKLQGIIDWSSARASFAEDDLRPLEREEWSDRPSIKTSFLAGYASIRPVPEYGEIMPLLQLSGMIAAIGFTVKRGTWKSKDARLYELNRRSLDTFFK